MTLELEVRKGVRKKTSLKTVPEEHDLELQASVYTPAKLQNSQQRNGDKTDNAESTELKYCKHASAAGYLTFPFTPMFSTFKNTGSPGLIASGQKSQAAGTTELVFRTPWV